MPFVLTDLVIDRVDLVDEGANTAAFIELYKRKERSDVMDVAEIIAKMKPEHAAVIQEALDTASESVEKAQAALTEREAELSVANEALAKANAELEDMKAAEDAKEDDDEMSKGASFDESEVLKAMPEAARDMFVKMREQKEAAEAQIRKAAEEKLEAEAVAKAATMKALPVEQSVLVSVIKSADQNIVDILEAASAAIEAATLSEVGKNAGNGASLSDQDAWSVIEAKANEIAKRDSVTKQKATQIAITENPDLYRKYLDGGAN